MNPEQGSLGGNEQAPPAGDWGNIRFRGRRPVQADDDGASFFYLGLTVFLAVALAFPWYSYWVSSYLLKRELTVASEEIGEQMRQTASRLKGAQAQAEAARSEAELARAEQQRQRDIAGVRVLGVSAGGEVPTVLVDLGRSSAADARQRICFLAGRWLKRELRGQVIRVQVFRGTEPASNAGRLMCN